MHNTDRAVHASNIAREWETVMSEPSPFQDARKGAGMSTMPATRLSNPSYCGERGCFRHVSAVYKT
jgi:hypothetical protein